MIEVNAAEAGNQANNIGQASDKLTISKNVTFSSGTTIKGNSDAKDSYTKVKDSATTIQQLLGRDVANIHSAVAAFQRSDNQVKQLFDSPVNLLGK